MPILRGRPCTRLPRPWGPYGTAHGPGPPDMRADEIRRYACPPGIAVPRHIVRGEKADFRVGIRTHPVLYADDSVGGHPDSPKVVYLRPDERASAIDDRPLAITMCDSEQRAIGSAGKRAAQIRQEQTSQASLRRCALGRAALSVAVALGVGGTTPFAYCRHVAAWRCCGPVCRRLGNWKRGGPLVGESVTTSCSDCRPGRKGGVAMLRRRDPLAVTCPGERSQAACVTRWWSRS